MRVLQILFALAILIFLSPLLFILTNLGIIFFKNPFYISTRSGIKGKEFKIIKFKSLFENDGVELSKNNDLLRQSFYGNFLRKSHLDEVPQLFNIISGSMNFFGPRPLWVHYIPLYSDYQMQRLSIKPGILGLSQVSGGNSLSWEHRLRYDVFYSKKAKSLALKLIILKRLFFGYHKIGTEIFSEAFKGNRI